MPSPLTEAQERVMNKAIRHRRVMISGGFGGGGPLRKHPDLFGTTREQRESQGSFDRRVVIEGLVAKRFLAPGKGANTFEPTPLGRAVWRGLRATRKAAAALKRRAQDGGQAEGVQAGEALPEGRARRAQRPEAGGAPA